MVPEFGKRQIITPVLLRIEHCSNRVKRGNYSLKREIKQIKIGKNRKLD